MPRSSLKRNFINDQSRSVYQFSIQPGHCARMTGYPSVSFSNSGFGRESGFPQKVGERVAGDSGVERIALPFADSVNSLCFAAKQRRFRVPGRQ